MTPDLQFFASPNRVGVIEIRGLIDNVQDSLKAFRNFARTLTSSASC